MNFSIKIRLQQIIGLSDLPEHIFKLQPFPEDIQFTVILDIEKQIVTLEKLEPAAFLPDKWQNRSIN